MQILLFPGNLPSGIPGGMWNSQKLTRSVCSWAAWLEKSLGDCWHSWQTWEIWERTKFPLLDTFSIILCSKSHSSVPSWIQGLAPGSQILDKRGGWMCFQHRKRDFHTFLPHSSWFGMVSPTLWNSQLQIPPEMLQIFQEKWDKSFQNLGLG